MRAVGPKNKIESKMKNESSIAKELESKNNAICTNSLLGSNDQAKCLVYK